MKQVLTRNVGLKILSLFLAVLSWVVIMNIDDPYITKTIDDIPVNILNENAVEENNKMYEIDSGDTATIKVKGKRSIVDGLKAEDFNAIADFKQMSMTYAVPIQISLKESSRLSEYDVEILKQTEMMTLSLEDADVQTFRINVVTIGEVPEGYYIAETIATPNLIEISGSKKQISKIKEITVEVDVSGRTESFEYPAKPVAYNENGYAVESSKLVFETNQVLVEVKILPTKDITLEIVQEGVPYYGYECSNIAWQPQKITIAGEIDDLKHISTLKIPFNVEGKKETIVSDISIEDYLDENYILVDENKSVAVTAKIEKLDSKDVMVRAVDINVRNLSNEYEVLFVTRGTITLRVMGLADKLDGILGRDLEPYIDLDGYSVGTYYVSVKSDVNSSVSVRPTTIGIEIVEKNID